MELSKIKRLFVPEGEVKKIYVGNYTVWEKVPLTSSIHILYDGNQNNSQPINIVLGRQENITGFYLICTNPWWREKVRLFTPPDPKNETLFTPHSWPSLRKSSVPRSKTF